MRKKFELVSGTLLLLISFAGVPASWKVYSAALIGALLVIAGLFEMRRDRKVSSQSAFVDGGPTSSAEKTTESQ